MSKILVVDDELSIRESFTLILEGKYQVTTAATGEAALKHVADRAFDLAYLDVRMPGLDGLETLRRLKTLDPRLEVVMVTAVNEVRKASEAIKLGARDYLIKPFDVEAIVKMTERILRRKALEQESSALLEERPQLVGQSEKIELVLQQAKKAASSDQPVLISGESGTEKEEIARLIHEQSARRELPFKRFSLSAGLTAAAVQARLFGRERGFTTADLQAERGLLDKVRGGTLFLAHLEYLPAKPAATAARLIGATDRSDLLTVNREIYDYFAAAIINLPPLRTRPGDLPLLIDRYLTLANRRYSRRISGFSAEANELLAGYSWPGNTLELRLLIDRAVLKAEHEEIGAAELPLDILLASGRAWGRDYTVEFEKRYIQKLRALSGLDRAGLASLLQVKPSYLE
ncbi:MAG: response regulator [Candidatus Margulisbacteria bacterium]|jgi:DNA-binding NtrC family response regulator|nr:response regulator [Candidatus Margulisiibacteriota bacterium]